MYVFVMMVLASLIAFSMSYTSPHRDDLVTTVEPIRAEAFATNMLSKHEAAILRSSLETSAGANGEESNWTMTGEVTTSTLKAGYPNALSDPAPLAAWYLDTETFDTLRFCVSDEPVGTPTYEQYRGIITGTCPSDANYYQAIMTYASPPVKYTKRSVYAAIRKKMKGHASVAQSAGILNWDAANSEWDIFPIGGGDASKLPKDIDNLIAVDLASSVPALTNGDIVIYTKTGLRPGW